ncbi:glycosyltransferase family 2 protein [Burkholderia multivorans]|uniref:glycosyltransferase family 2 protein n=2 Tax=Burkholderia multivorans TaxID=87883 RepID=UPI00075A85A7|nr:glycosyltransferase family 2 protein [Burkholderia multivorans]KVS08898.1 glycosyl transferase [Burkholderia multivorans]MDN8100033.1 glycosyltransferase family 2 protein [Burkholderia multivorans]
MNTVPVTDTTSVVLSVSIVVYRPDLDRLTRTLASLERACEKLWSRTSREAVALYLVDNGGLPSFDEAVSRARGRGISCCVISGQGNVGFGRGHNLALRQVTSQYHLVLNPDIDLDENALIRGFDFLERHRNMGLLSPWIGDAQGQQQFLCRRYPSLVDLFVRGFLPVGLHGWFKDRLAHYEMRDVINDREVLWEPPIVSGCFMMFRTEVLKKLGGFDPRYFLYFEDYDLSLRAHEVADVAYVPSVRVIHHGGGASRKGFTHIRMFAVSAFKFFNRFGWRVW